MRRDSDDPDSLLPLPPATFHILMALADMPRHGYAIMQDIVARTDGEIRLSAGTLYRSIQRLLEQGLVTESNRRPPQARDDPRRRYYQLTRFGTAVARAETQRLERLVRLAHARNLAARPS